MIRIHDRPTKGDRRGMVTVDDHGDFDEALSAIKRACRESGARKIQIRSSRQTGTICVSTRGPVQKPEVESVMVAAEAKMRGNSANVRNDPPIQDIREYVKTKQKEKNRKNGK